MIDGKVMILIFKDDEYQVLNKVLSVLSDTAARTGVQPAADF